MTIRSPDLNLLVILSILLQTRNVGRAAQRLGLSQPTVSRALSALRLMFADPLLVRSSGGMALTPRAVALIKPLEDWLLATNAMLEPAAFDAATLDRTFSVATTDFGVLSVVSPALPAMMRQAPSCRVDIAAFSADMFKKLASGELDLIVYGFEPDRSIAHARHLFSETQCLIVRAGHPLAARDPAAPMSLDDYLAWPHVGIAIGEPDVDHVQTCLGMRADERRVFARVPYFYAAPDLIGGSDAILTLPRRAAQRLGTAHGLVCLDAPAEIRGFDYWVLWHERSARDPAIAWFIKGLAQAI